MKRGVAGLQAVAGDGARKLLPEGSTQGGVRTFLTPWEKFRKPVNGEAEMYRVNQEDNPAPETGKNVLRGDNLREIKKD